MQGLETTKINNLKGRVESGVVLSGAVWVELRSGECACFGLGTRLVGWKDFTKTRLTAAWATW